MLDYDRPGFRHYRMRREEVQSSAAVPLKLRRKVTETPSVKNSRINAFSGYQLDLLQCLADQAAIAIQNTRLSEELDERATQLEQLQRVTAAFSAEPSDLEKVLHSVAKGLRDIFREASCVISQYDAARDAFGQCVVAGISKKRVDYPPRPGGTSRHMVETKTPRYIEDTSIAPLDGGPAVAEEIVKQGVRAAAHLPLVIKGEVKEILYVNLGTPHQFSQNEKRILELFADQAAIAIENTRLYAELADKIKQINQRNVRLEVLNEISRMVSTLGTNQVLDLAYYHISRIMDLSDALFYVAFL